MDNVCARYRDNITCCYYNALPYTFFYDLLDVHSVTYRYRLRYRKMSQPRCSNFTEEQKSYLCDLARRHSAVEKKGYDTKTLGEKKKAWNTIETKFQAAFPTGRKSLKQIQGCWERMKKQCKTDHEAFRREQRRTGGGPAPTPPDGISKTVAGIIAPAINPFENEYDDDASDDANEAETGHDETMDDVRSPSPPSPTLPSRSVSVPAPAAQTSTRLSTPRRVSTSTASTSTQSATPRTVPGASSPRRHVKDSRKVKPKIDPFLKLAKKEHRIKMRILRLKECKLRRECRDMNIDLPSGLDDDSSSEST